MAQQIIYLPIDDFEVTLDVFAEGILDEVGMEAEVFLRTPNGHINITEWLNDDAIKDIHRRLYDELYEGHDE